jgi:hypothetical protein
MAAKDFQELIKAQQETTIAMMSAEDAAKYNSILAERKLEFDKKSQAVKRGIETKKAKDESEDRQQAAAAVEKATTEKAETDKQLIAIAKKPALLRTAEEQGKFLEENNRKIEEKAKADGIQFKDTKTWQKNQDAIDENNLKLREQAAGKDISAAAQKEIDDERTKLQEKNQGLLGKIAGGLGGLLEQGKQKIKDAAGGAFKFIKGLAIAGLALAVVAFLNSPAWVETKKYIVDTLVPTLKRFYNAFFGPKGGFMNGISELFGDESGIGSIVLGIGAVVTALAAFKVLTIALKMVKGFKIIQAGFISMQAAMAATKLSLATALVPMLPIIAIAAAIGVVIFAMKEALSDFQKVMEDGGSITEAFKVGGAKFLGFILGFIPSLITDLVGFVAGLLGFEEVEAKMNTIDPIQMISDAITDIFDGIADFFSGIGNDFSVIGGNIADMGKKFLQAILQTVLPKPGEGGFFKQMISKVIPNEVYEFAGMNPKTGEIIPPVVDDMISSSLKPNALGKVVGKPDFENRMDSRAKQLYDAKLAQTSGQGAPIIVSAPSTNVIDNSSSSSTLTSTPLTNNNPSVNAINYAR